MYIYIYRDLAKYIQIHTYAAYAWLSIYVKWDHFARFM